LRNVTDWRGRLGLREVAACLSAARLFVGGEGFLMHLARAVDRRAVIVLGGRTAAHQTCYPENANLATPLPCSPCWQMSTCAHNRECLNRITPEDVCAAVETQLSLPPLTSVRAPVVECAR
jgi:ADP-heptose:LPS heptosyltransferase